MLLGLHERGAWRLITRWMTHENKPSEHVLNHGAITIVTDPSEAWAILRNSSEYHRDSGFFMTKDAGTLPPPALAHMSTGIKAVLRAHTPEVSYAKRNLVASTRILTQEFGARFAYDAFRQHLGIDRHPALKSAAELYLEKVVIPFSIQGQWPTVHMKHFERAIQMLSSSGSLRPEMGEGITTPDVASVVSSLPVSLTDKGELFLRQVLAFVGFTGVAFEWLLYLVAKDQSRSKWIPTQEDSMDFVLEAQRTYPTAWRLIRTTTEPLKVAGRQAAAGEDILIPTYLFHQDARWWSDPNKFDPQRWRSRQTVKGAFLPFGAGPGVCPAAAFIPSFLAKALRSVLNTHQIRSGRYYERKPRALSLLATPRTRLLITPRG